MQLKRWESPRRQGRNDKGKGGSARARQLRKQQQMLRKKLKDNCNEEQKEKSQTRGGEKSSPSFYLYIIPKKTERYLILNPVVKPYLKKGVRQEAEGRGQEAERRIWYKIRI